MHLGIVSSVAVWMQYKTSVIVRCPGATNRNYTVVFEIKLCFYRASRLYLTVYDFADRLAERANPKRGLNDTGQMC